MRSPTTTSHSHALEARVRFNLEHRCGVAPGARLLVAVSGGADSVALLALLASTAPHLGLALEVAHFDHALRPDSSADARWVGERARELGFRFHESRWKTPSPGEAAARAARHGFLGSTASAFGCDAIALGHHLDDQLETILLRLGRGAGLRGVLGMAWRRSGVVPIVRPLLDVRRAELRQYLEARGLAWREDETNRDPGPARNRVRSRVIPALDGALGPHWSEHWHATWNDLHAVFDWLDAEAVELLRRAHAGEEPPRLDVAVLRAAPEPVLRAALQRWLDVTHSEINRSHLDTAVRLVHRGTSGRRIELPAGWRLASEQGRLALLAPAPVSSHAGRLRIEPLDVTRAQSELNAAARLEGREVEVERTPDAAGERDHAPEPARAIVAADRLRPPLVLRTAVTGDRLRVLGAPGHRSIARLLQDRRVPRRLRAGWPVVADADGPVWVPGVGLSERARVGPATQMTWLLEYVATGSPAASASFPAAPPEGLPEAHPAS